MTLHRVVLCEHRTTLCKNTLKKVAYQVRLFYNESNFFQKMELMAGNENI